MTINDLEKRFEEALVCYNFDEKSKTPLKLTYHQKNILKSLLADKNIIIRKSRCIGFDTLIRAFIANEMIEKEQTQVVFVIPTFNGGYDREKFKQVIKTLIDVYKPEYTITAENYNKLSISNGSTIHFTTSTKKWGFDIDWLVLIEAAFFKNNLSYEDFEPMFHSKNGHVVVCSTPNGHDPLFYKMYMDAKNGNNDFNIVDCIYKPTDDRYVDALSWERYDNTERGLKYKKQELDALFDYD